MMKNKCLSHLQTLQCVVIKLMTSNDRDTQYRSIVVRGTGK